MKSPRNRLSSKRDDLPEWAAEVQPDEDVMRLFYARTGQPRSGPLIPPRHPSQATAKQQDPSNTSSLRADSQTQSAPAYTSAETTADITAITTITTAAINTAQTAADTSITTGAASSATTAAEITATSTALSPARTSADIAADIPASIKASSTAQSPAGRPARQRRTPADTPAGSPAISSPIEFDREVAQEKGPFVPLDATHTSAEAKVYSIMYRQTISRGLRERHFSNLDLMKATGLRSDNTVRAALRGLRAKLSIELIGHERFFRYGQNYRVYSPKEIFEARQRVKMVIEPKTKRILSSAVSYAATSADSQAAASSRIEGLLPQKLRDMLNHVNSDDEVDTSSSRAYTDEDKLAKVQKLFEQLSAGGAWKDERDRTSFQEIATIPLWHIIVGLCYSVSRATEHRMASFAYAVPAIKQHFEQMQAFPETEMLEIAYRTMRRTLNCLETGKWTIPEWESGASSDDPDH
jgi:hypothetical protein